MGSIIDPDCDYDSYYTILYSPDHPNYYYYNECGVRLVPIDKPHDYELLDYLGLIGFYKWHGVKEVPPGFTPFDETREHFELFRFRLVANLAQVRCNLFISNDPKKGYNNEAFVGTLCFCQIHESFLVARPRNYPIRFKNLGRTPTQNSRKTSNPGRTDFDILQFPGRILPRSAKEDTSFREEPLLNSWVFFLQAILGLRSLLIL